MWQIPGVVWAEPCFISPVIAQRQGKQALASRESCGNRLDPSRSSQRRLTPHPCSAMPLLLDSPRLTSANAVGFPSDPHKSSDHPCKNHR